MSSTRALTLLVVLVALGAAWANQQQPARRLLSPIYSESNSIRAADTPYFRYNTAPTPAGVQSSFNARSDRPFVDVAQSEPDWFTAQGSTSLDTWEGAEAGR